MPVAPVRIINRTSNVFIDTYAVLDTAAEFNICSAELAKLLQLQGDTVITSVIGATGAADEGISQRVTMSLRGYRTTELHEIEAYALTEMTDLRDHIPRVEDIGKYPHLRGLRIPDHARKRVDLLIGIGESHLHHRFDARCGERGQLWATLTGLGWVLHGRDATSVAQPQTMHVSTCQVHRSLRIKDSHHDNDRLLKLVERQLALDFNEPQHDTDMRLSSREQEMLKRQQSSVKRVTSGKYEIGLLWKIDPSALADNRAMALGSLKSLGK